MDHPRPFTEDIRQVTQNTYALGIPVTDTQAEVLASFLRTHKNGFGATYALVGDLLIAFGIIGPEPPDQGSMKITKVSSI
jgi:hypothetical protein